jgi:hypothetical protein
MPRDHVPVTFYDASSACSEVLLFAILTI